MSSLKTKRVWPVVVLVLLGFFVAARLRRPPEVAQPRVGVIPEIAASDSGRARGTENAGDIVSWLPDTEDSRLLRGSDGSVAMAPVLDLVAGLNSPQTTALTDVQLLDEVFANYRLVMGSNPVGSDNPEIVGQLAGKNPRKLVLIPPDHPAMSAAGELVDRWNHPYYFHPLARDRMDVRSAGPDGKLWTRDDISLGLDEQEPGLNR